ncbi:hypothetical protein Tco_0196635 [Tanacetum coccineum]
MSANSAVTYTSVHSEARSWSIPSEDPYEEATRQLFEQAPRSPEYVPDPIELEDPTTHPPIISLLPSEDTPLLPIPIPAPSLAAELYSRRLTRPLVKWLTITTPKTSCVVGESSAAVLCDTPGVHYGLHRERLAYEQESKETRQALARSEAYYKALEARVTVLETKHVMQPEMAMIAILQESDAEGYASCSYLPPTRLHYHKMPTLNFKGHLRVVEMLLHGATLPMLRPYSLKMAMQCHGKVTKKTLTAEILAQGGEIKKLEFECEFEEESDKVEKYVGGLPDMIHGSVMATKPKTMQDAIEDLYRNLWIRKSAHLLIRTS